MLIRIFFLLLVGSSSALAQNFTSIERSILSDGGPGFGSCHLGATLLVPVGTTAKALVLFVHGSGTTNRDEEAPTGNRPFKDIAEWLSKNGYATLRFDKRGIQPECQPPLIGNQSLTPKLFIQDVRNIIKYIESDSEVNQLPLILLGHSEGVNFVTEIASLGVAKLKAVVLLAGLGKYSIDETILRQYRQILLNPNLSPVDRAAVQSLIDTGEIFFGKIRSGTVLASDSYMSIYSKYWSDWIDITRNGANSANLVEVPSYVVRGTLDTNVTAEDFDALKVATQDVPFSSSYVATGVDHFFASPGSMSVSHDVLDGISTWLEILTTVPTTSNN